VSRSRAALEAVEPVDYFAAVLGFKRSWLVVARYPVGAVVAEAIAAVPGSELSRVKQRS
jgi:hypothetical protein